MKKIFTLVSFGFCSALVAQTLPSFSIYKTNNLGAYTATLTNGGGFVETTTAGDTNPLESKLTIKNNAAVTQTFNVVRRILSQNPPLILDGSSNTPNSYFCFGSDCFTSPVNTPPVSDPGYTLTTLSAAGSPTTTTIPKADNSRGAGQAFVTYFLEGETAGNYVIQYKVFNVANPNDSIAFKIGYNQSVGIKSLSKSADLVSEIYPNPASGASKIYIDLAKDEELKFQVYNSLGSVVYTGSKQKYTAGKNHLSMDGLELNSGIYFITLSNTTSTTTKRLIITK